MNSSYRLHPDGLSKRPLTYHYKVLTEIVKKNKMLIRDSSQSEKKEIMDNLNNLLYNMSLKLSLEKNIGKIQKLNYLAKTVSARPSTLSMNYLKKFIKGYINLSFLSSLP